MKKLIIVAALLMTLTGCVVTPHTGAKPYIPTINTETVSIGKDGVHIPNVIYPLKVNEHYIPVYIDTGSISLDEFLCKLNKTC